MESIDLDGETHQQSKLLFRLLNDLFRRAGCERLAVQEIAIGLGPGSYTGLRVGLSLAKTWAYATGAKLYSFSSRALLEKTQKEDPDAQHPQVRYLGDLDLKPVEDIVSLAPIYENDHFSKSG